MEIHIEPVKELTENLAGVRAYRPAPQRRILITSVFVALYSVAVYYCIATSGVAHNEALERIRKKNRENFFNKTDSKTVLPDDPLPFEWAPAPWAGLLMGTVVSLHAFFHLMCYWRPSFHAAALFERASQVRSGCSVLVTPQEHKGNAALTAVRRSEHTGRCGFEFQRLRYEVVYFKEGGGKLLDEEDDDFDFAGPPTVRRVVCPFDRPVGEYAKARGLDEDKVEILREQYGQNLLTVPVPSFLMCYKEQILSPMCIFQLFLSLLWAMDDYLSYTLMQLSFILMFESSTVFQRQRTMKMLNGMTVKPFDVKVFRDGSWVELSTSDLLPGDLMQLSADRPGAGTESPASGEPAEGQNKEPSSEEAAKEPTLAEISAAWKDPHTANADANAGVCVVPCDCILLRGEAVVNEASLTGESVPQMKEALIVDEPARPLDIEGIDAVHMLSSGTSPMSAKAGEPPRSGLGVGLPEPPDGGCLCYVLRTGFSSSQGKLLQLIEFSSDRTGVKADEREMSIALLVLLGVALCAAGYVLKQGLEKGDKTLYELVIRCVIIISSVVPRNLPMTMAVAVNTALMTLMRSGIFCIEPHRVPGAGKLTHCLFDKTGTITTDTLSLEGIINSGDGKEVSEQNDETTADGETSASTRAALGLVGARSASPHVALVLGACHSLVSVDGKSLTGDPIEVSALRSVGWSFDASAALSKPCEAEAKKGHVEEAKRELQQLISSQEAGKVYTTPDGAAKERAEKEQVVKAAEEALRAAEARDAAHPIEAVRILQRYRFASKLQRSCTVVHVSMRKNHKQGSGDTATAVHGLNALKCGRYALVKGSPEALEPLMASGARPAWYESRYRDLAENGMRVLALALKELPAPPEEEVSPRRRIFNLWGSSSTGPASGDTPASPDIPSRESAESELTFVGFIAFSCRTRTDSTLVISSLRESAHTVALVTGDSPLTALHVARQTGICASSAEALVLQATEDGEVTWAVATGKCRGEPRLFKATGLRALAQDEGFELMTTEASLRAAGQKHPEIWHQLEAIHVFARMTPQGKADVIRALQKQQCKVLMCGDGGNDMGALKQSDVGLALMAGYGNMNAGDTSENDGKSKDGKAVVPAEEQLNAQQKELAKRGRDMAKEKQRLFMEKQRELQAKQKVWVEEELQKRQDSGLPLGFMGHAAALKTVMARFSKELQSERRELDKKFGNVYDNKKAKDPMDKMKEMMGEDAGADGMPFGGGMTIRPGDASLAAAFTSKVPSIKSTVDLIRQGRCALLSALQQQQITMLNCLINAFVLSAPQPAESRPRGHLGRSFLVLMCLN